MASVGSCACTDFYEVRALTIRLESLIIAITSVGLISVLYGASPKFEKASSISSPKQSSPAGELEPIGAQGRAQYSFRNGSDKCCAVRTNQIQSLTRVFVVPRRLLTCIPVPTDWSTLSAASNRGRDCSEVNSE